MRVAVTGAGGHLGGVLVRRLLDDGHDVVAVDLVRTRALDGLAIDYIEGDVLDRQAMENAFDGVDVVCHLAAIISVVGDPTGLVRRVNVEGPEIVADAAMSAGVRRMVHCSSVHAFDLSAATEPLTEAAPRAVHPRLPAYDRSKRAGEQAVQSRVAAGLDATIINPTGVIGPYDFAPSRMGEVFLAIRVRRLRGTIDGGGSTGSTCETSRRGSSQRSTPEERERTTSCLATVSRCPISPLRQQRQRESTHLRTRCRRGSRGCGGRGTRLARRSDSPLALTEESLHALFNGPSVSSAKARAELGYEARPFEETVRDIYAWFEA